MIEIVLSVVAEVIFGLFGIIIFFSSKFSSYLGFTPLGRFFAGIISLLIMGTIIYLQNLDKIREYLKDKRKREDIEKIRRKREAANDAKNFGWPIFQDNFERGAEIIEETMEK